MEHQYLTNILKNVAAILLVLCHESLGNSEERCEECAVVHRYINASGDNYVTFEPCLMDSSCLSYCLDYEISSVIIQLLEDRQKLNVYWNSKEIFLAIPSSFGDNRDMTQPQDVAVNVAYVCHMHDSRLPLYTSSMNVTARLKAISVELHVNSSHGQVGEGKAMSVECVVTGPFNSQTGDTHIHHQGADEADLNCTYENDVNSNDNTKSSAAKICSKIITDFSQSKCGRYFCAVTIGEKYFPSNSKNIQMEPKKPGLNETSLITIGVAGAVVALTVLLLVASLTANVFLRRKPPRCREGEIAPLLHRDLDVQPDYQAVEADLEGSGHRGGSPANSDRSVHSGSSRTTVSVLSTPDSHVELPHQEGSEEIGEV